MAGIYEAMVFLETVRRLVQALPSRLILLLGNIVLEKTICLIDYLGTTEQDG
jgi:hypothetical protein